MTRSEVRAARSDDAEALRRLDRLTRSSQNSPGVMSDAGFFDGDTVPHDVLVLDAGTRLLGYVELGRPTRLLSNAHVLEICGLAVDPAEQAHGHGRRLVEAAVEECARRGARKVSLRVLAPNTAARRLYERCGFVEQGVLEREFLLEGSYVDDVLMARWLP